MSQRGAQVFGAILSLVVLIIYAVLLGSGIYNAFANPETSYTDVSLQAANLVTGLVGSVVAAGLALQQPQPRPRQESQLRGRVMSLSQVVAPHRVSISTQEAIGWAYLTVWLVIGLAAFLVTVTRPDVPALVSNTGWTWLGTAVAATYAYFGIERT